jgi:acetolactate synthase I/II/III large subunit
MNGAEALIRGLQERGVEFISLLCGNGTEGIITAAHEAGLRMIDTRNEQAASYLAEAHAKLTRRIGVCVVSSAIAHVNAMSGMMNAWFDGTPFLLITGHSESSHMRRGNFQDCDHIALSAPLCKYTELVTRAQRIPQALHEAIAAATSGRPGPVHLTIPRDALEGEVDGALPGPSLGARGLAVERAAAPAEAIAAASELLAGAKRPLIVAGSGVFYADGGAAMRSLAHQVGAPMVSPIWERGAVNTPDDLFLGVIGGASGEPDLQPRADLMLIAGAAVDYRTRYLDRPPLQTDLKVIRVDVDTGRLHLAAEADVALLGDPATVFGQLSAVYAGGGHAEWVGEARQVAREFYAGWEARPETEPGAMTGYDLVHALRECLTPDTAFVVDGGNIGQWAHKVLLSDRYPETLLTCGASGVIGYGVPGAMAARLAWPGKRVLLLTGDGSLGFCLPEFLTAARHDLPFVAVLANDEAWGIVVSGQRRAGKPCAASYLGPCGWVQAVEGLGGRGVRVESADQIAAAVEEGFASGMPTLVEVPLAVMGAEVCRG